MTAGTWRVRLGDAARQDFADIVQSSLRRFGPLQASAYQDLMLEAVSKLQAGPNVPGHRRHDDIRIGLKTIRVAKPGRRGSHRLVYIVLGARAIDVVRILHDRMDIRRHVPPSPS